MHFRVLLQMACHTNDNTIFGSRNIMNRRFGNAAHAKALANFCLAKCFCSSVGGLCVRWHNGSQDSVDNKLNCNLCFQNYRMSFRYRNNPSLVRTERKKYKRVLAWFQWSRHGRPKIACQENGVKCKHSIRLL